MVRVRLTVMVSVSVGSNAVCWMWSYAVNTRTVFYRCDQRLYKPAYIISGCDLDDDVSNDAVVVADDVDTAARVSRCRDATSPRSVRQQTDDGRRRVCRAASTVASRPAQ